MQTNTTTAADNNRRRASRALLRTRTRSPASPRLKHRARISTPLAQMRPPKFGRRPRCWLFGFLAHSSLAHNAPRRADTHLPHIDGLRLRPLSRLSPPLPPSALGAEAATWHQAGDAQHVGDRRKRLLSKVSAEAGRGAARARAYLVLGSPPQTGLGSVRVVPPIERGRKVSQ